VLGYKSRRPYYRALDNHRKTKAEQDLVLELTKGLRRFMPRTGSKKVYLDIKDDIQQAGFKIGRDKVHKYLKDNQLIIKPKKNYKTTTDSNHHFRKFKNRIRFLDINKPELVFVNDITYIRIKKQFAYLFLVTDAYSKKIMGWTINYTMKVKDAKKAILMAHKNRRFNNELFHHSDRGIQYCTPSYTHYIQKKNMIPSMTEDLHVYENPIAERINGILKGEFGIGQGFSSLKEARSVIDKVIFIYNNQRRHLSLHYLTPNFVHFNPGIKIKTWKSNNSKYFNSKKL